MIHGLFHWWCELRDWENEVNVVDPNVTLQLLNTMGTWGKVVDTGTDGNDETVGIARRTLVATTELL